MKTIDLLVRHGRVLTMEAAGHVVEDGAVAVDRGIIVAVGPTAELDRDFAGRSMVDAQGAVIRPGFIDAHIHVSQYTARSALPRLKGMALTMGDWKAQLRPEDERASARLAAADYLACGYTGFVDPGTIFEPDAVAGVADEMGIRLWLTDPYVADRGRELGETSPELVGGGFLARWPADLDEAAARVGGQLWRNRAGGLARAFVGIYGENTESDALRAHAIRMARDAGVQFQMHLGYTPAGYRARTTELGCTPLQAISDATGLDGGQTYVHLNLVEDADERLLTRSRPAVVWCPYGTLQVASAGARSRMVELEQAGLAVALATDIPRVVNFDGIAGVALACAAASGHALDPWRLLAMRSWHAAQGVGAQELCGRLAAGLSADLVVEQPHELDVCLPHEVAALSGRRTVRHVYVAGRQTMKDGQSTDCDVAALRADAARSCRNLLERIGH